MSPPHTQEMLRHLASQHTTTPWLCPACLPTTTCIPIPTQPTITMTNYICENSHGQSQSSMTTGERCTFSNNLNDFFCRYENTDHNQNVSDLINRTSGQSPYDGFTINKEDVKKVFTKVNVRKSAGPDGVCSKLMKVCAP